MFGLAGVCVERLFVGGESYVKGPIAHPRTLIHQSHFVFTVSYAQIGAGNHQDQVHRLAYLAATCLLL